MRPNDKTWWETAFPAVTWLRNYHLGWLRLDLLAGVTLAAYLLPAALGDASLANLPPEAGLYACLFGGLIFWIFCGSRYTVVSITSAISLVIGSSLGEITGGNTARFGALAAGTTLSLSLIAFVAWLAKAGVLVHFISESVMTGFKCGVALFLASTQLPKLFGFHGAHGSFWGNTGFFFKHLNETNTTSVFAGFGGGLPVSGGTSQSLVNEDGGAKTPLSTALAAVFILVVVLFFSQLLSALPQPVLAAVVLVAIAGLLNLSTLKELWLTDRSEFVVAIAAFAGVLTFGLLRGVMLGALISLVQLVRVSSRPHVALLGRIPGTRRFSDCDRHADNELIPNVMIFRPESALVYFNVDNVYDAILNRVRAEPTTPKLIVLDLSEASNVDMQSAHTLASLADELTAAGIQFHAVEARSSVRDRLRREGIDAKLGGVNRFSTVAD